MPYLRSLILVALLAAQAASAKEEISTVQGTPALVADKLSDFRLIGQRPEAEYSSILVEGQSFDWAIRVRVAARTPNSWDVQILTPPTIVPLKKGEHILAILNVRCADAPSGIGIFNAFIQASEPPWTKIASTEVAVSNEWRRVYLYCQADRDFAAGEYGISLFLGAQAQTLEFGGIAMLNLGANVDAGTVPFAPIAYPGQELDASWRKAAAERIEKHRKAELTVRVVDRDGKPVDGANVHVQMRRHAYGFGTVLKYPDSGELPEVTASSTPAGSFCPVLSSHLPRIRPPCGSGCWSRWSR
ncbi:MAG: hypothetical protein HY770_03685 [Chitinivibrionia bacterium]|nr:hypothetical protein [Chitinivibrionia bacterium]